MKEDRLKTQEEYDAALKEVFETAKRVLDLPLDRMASMMERAESFGPFKDPTLYRKAAAQLHQHKIIVDALRMAQQKLGPARDELLQLMVADAERATSFPPSGK